MTKAGWRNPKIWVLFLISTIVTLYLYQIPLEQLSFLSPTYWKILRFTAIMLALFLFLEKLFSFQLHTKIIWGLIFGVAAGVYFGTAVTEVKPVGDAFLRLIQMIVVPLVLSSLIAGTASLGDPKKMGRIGIKTFAYYLVSTSVAITVGLIFANVFKPGTGLSPDVQAQLLQNYGGEAGSKISQLGGKMNMVDTLLNIIPKNPVGSLADASMLQIIFFSIFTGIALTIIPKEKAQPVIDIMYGIMDAMIKIVILIIKIAPYGVFALIAHAIGSFGLNILYTLLKYSLVVTGGLIVLTLIYPAVVHLFTGMGYFTFWKGIRPAQLIAFSTSSSSATLPVTMESCEENLGVSNEIASFVLPLGATVNMDGTALYQGVAALFIAQVYGIPLDLGAQLTIILTATLASIGTAAVPGVGLIMLVIVLKQVGIPLEGIALILSVDRIIDMFRTAINITSDATAAVIVAKSEGALNPPKTID